MLGRLFVSPPSLPHPPPPPPRERTQETQLQPPVLRAYTRDTLHQAASKIIYLTLYVIDDANIAIYILLPY